MKHINYCLPIGNVWYLKGLAWLLKKIKISGLNDLLPNSRCIKQIENFIHSDAHTIPCLLIAGYYDNLGKYLLNKAASVNLPMQVIQSFNDAYGQFITEKQAVYHDGLIPLSSQLLWV
jgi:hypothetical protein